MAEVAPKSRRGRPTGATAAREREREIGRHLLDILVETPDSDLRGRLRGYATWLAAPVGARAAEGGSE